MKGTPCEGKPRVCPGHCNPRNHRGGTDGGPGLVPYREETSIVNHNNNVYYQHSYALYSTKRTQTAVDSRGEAGLSPEEKCFVDCLSRRIEARKRRRCCKYGRTVKRLIAFLLFFFLHGLIAAFARNYQQYQTFLATQFCGFITIMFWEDPRDE